MSSRRRLQLLLGHALRSGPVEAAAADSAFEAVPVEYSVTGTAAPGFERVRRAFDENFAMGLEVGSQLCIYWKGKCVVDLAGSISPDMPSTPGGQVVDQFGDPVLPSLRGYGHNSIQQVFSSTKNLTAITMAMAVDRNLLSYGEKVAKYWPEFAQNGKQDLLVEDVLRHDSGLAQFVRMGTAEDMEDQKPGGKLSRLIEESPPNWWKAKGTTAAPEMTTLRRGYHGLSRGLILSQILQRVDPQKRTVGQFLREEVAKPMGLEQSLFIGIPLEVQRSGQVHITKMVANETMNRVRTFGKDKKDWPKGQQWSVPDPDKKVFQKAIMGPHMKDGFVAVGRIACAESGPRNSEWSRMIESPSANGHTNARSLGKIAAAMANKGTSPDGGVRLMSSETWEKAHSGVTQKFDDLLFTDARFAAGGFAEFRMDKASLDTPEGTGSAFGGADTKGLKGSFWGWGGAGGSIFIWSPDHQVGFAYTMSGMTDYILGSPRTKRIFEALCESLVAAGQK